MDYGNSGSISSSGDEEYDSRADHTLLPSTFLNQPTPQFGSLISSSHHQTHHHHHHHHPSLFDLSSTYLHALSQSQPNSNPNSFPNLDTATSQGRRSEPDCTDTAGGVSSSSSPPINQSLLAPHQGFGQCVTDPSLQLRSVVHDDNNNNNATRVVLSPSPTTNAARNSKKRTRASRRAPTTVLTTDTSNFRAMVQEFTGIPAPPFSGGSSYSRRLDLLTASSSLRSSSSHLDTTSAFYPLRPSPQKLHHHHPNSLFLSSSSPPSPSTLLHNNSMVDAIASTTNISSAATANSSASNNNSVNYQLPPDLGLPYNHHPQNIMLSMQNHPILTFHPPPPQALHPFGTGGFGAKSQAGLSVQSLEDLGVSQGQVNVHLGGSGGVSVPTGHHGHVSSEGMTLRCASEDGGGGSSRRDALRSLGDGSYNGGKVAASSAGGGGGGSCKLNFSASASGNLNHDKTLENNNSSRGEGAVDSWICSSD